MKVAGVFGFRFLGCHKSHLKWGLGLVFLAFTYQNVGYLCRSGACRIIKVLLGHHASNVSLVTV